MRLSFFGLLLASSVQAMTLLNADGFESTDVLSLAQTEAENNNNPWKSSDGSLTSNSKSRVNKNCCIFYEYWNFNKGKTTENQTQEVCYRNGEVNNQVLPFKVNSILCGSETFSKIGEYKTRGKKPEKFAGTAGFASIPDYGNGVSIHSSFWNDWKKTYVLVGPYNVAENPAIMLFMDPACQGIPKVFFFDDHDDDGTSFYNLEDLVRQDIIKSYAGYAQSIMVPFGFEATLYPQEAWRGAGETLHGISKFQQTKSDDRTFKDDLVCQHVKNSSDKNGSYYVKSLSISKKKQGKVSGYWKSITASEPQKFRYEVGISDSQSQNDVNSSMNKMRDSLETGVDAKASVEGGAGFVSASASVNASTKYATTTDEDSWAKQEMLSVADSSTTMVHETECKPHPGDQGPVGLWQWVVTTSDYSVSAFTNHTICRTGKLALEPPECPFRACINYNCSKCAVDPAKK